PAAFSRPLLRLPPARWFGPRTDYCQHRRNGSAGLGTAGCCGPGCAAGHQVAPLSMVHGYSVFWPGCPAAPAVARTATASRTPQTQVAVSGITVGPWKPDMAACGADAAPISNAAQPAQRR